MEAEPAQPPPRPPPPTGRRCSSRSAAAATRPWRRRARRLRLRPQRPPRDERRGPPGLQHVGEGDGRGRGRRDGEAAAAAVEALLPPTVELGAVAAGVATALEHLPASLRDSDRCIGLLLEAAGEPGGGRSPASSGEVRILAARRLLEVTAEALHSMDLGEIGSDASMPGFAPRQPQPGVSKTKAAAANGVKKFLNRLLAKTIEVQVVVFAFFMACLEAKIAMAKVRESERGERSFELQRARSDSMSFFSHPLSSFFFAHLAPSVSTLSSNLKTKKQQRAGTFDPGVSKLVGTLVPESESSFGAVVAGRAAETTDAAAANTVAAAAAPDELFRLLWRERQPPHRELRFVELRIDRGVSFEAAMARLRAQLPKPHPRARTGFFVSRNRIIGPHFAVLLALVRGYSAPVGAAAAAAEAADAAVAASENGRRRRRRRKTRKKPPPPLQMLSPLQPLLPGCKSSAQAPTTSTPRTSSTSTASSANRR